MKTEIISFFSDIDGHTYYSDHAARLANNCKEHNIPYDIRKLESNGSYRMNCLRKPNFILDMLRLKNKPIVWLDVDSIIHNELSIFDDKENHCDLIFAYSGMTPQLINPKYPKASPIYLTPKSIVFDFLEFWVDKCEENASDSTKKVFDHEVLLFDVLPIFMKKMKVGVLPVNYAIWPTDKLPDDMKKYITMGIADNKSKETSLREMGFSESAINFNLLRI
jgi:hypothetical protein